MKITEDGFRQSHYRKSQERPKFNGSSECCCQVGVKVQRGETWIVDEGIVVPE